jgi:hypothetical protein
MGLSYNEQYNIATGIHMAFSNKKSARILSVSHGQKKRDQMKSSFPYKQYENWTKSNFIIACLYVAFKKSPSSVNSMYAALSDVEEREVLTFKNEIIYYRKFLQEDINYIKINEGNSVNIDTITELYRNNKIKWFTFYFYVIVSGTDQAKLERSRINGYLLRKIKKLLLYVTFSEKSMMEIKQIMKEGIDI